MDSFVCLVPAYEPKEQMVSFIEHGLSLGIERFLIVNDGSPASCDGYFREAEALGATVIAHGENRGKGAALKTGIAYVAEHMPDVLGVVTADADGEYSPEDILLVAQSMAGNPVAISLGVRNFGGPDVPLKDRIGTAFTSFVYKQYTGMECRDSHTGLRGIPRAFYDFALATPGERYEWEMNLLTAAPGRNIELKAVPAETSYTGANRVTHFHFLRDSYLIYRRQLTFVSTSLTCSLIDIILFQVFLHFLFSDRASMMLLSTVMARVISGALNFTLNKRLTFRVQGNSGAQSAKYLILFLCIMLASGIFVRVFSFLPIPTWLVKVIVDVSLFFVNYFGQKLWVFKKKKK